VPGYDSRHTFDALSMHSKSRRPSGGGEIGLTNAEEPAAPGRE
jgi:hypothetical protein